ncbi:MAG TPA: VWA domain-containing protein [Methanocella sp.]|nr:VWA domain-containing protein [Methanocella sp.]
MIFPEEKRVRMACAKMLVDPSNARSYDMLLTGCRSIGRNLIRFYHIIPPTSERMVYKTYDGSGMISFDRTIAECCKNGKTIESMITYHRVRDVKKVRLAILYDDSNSMTAWWRKQAQMQDIDESEAPQTYAKIACLSMMEGLGKDIDINFWKFGSQSHGPFNMSSNMYREIIRCNGSGGTRLDLALESLIEHKWYHRPGMKIVMILTDGIPEAGHSAYSEDVLINMKTLGLIKNLMRNKIHVIYIQMLTDESRKFKKSGGYTLLEFGNEIQQMGCEYITVNSKASLMRTLFEGLNTINKI